MKPFRVVPTYRNMLVFGINSMGNCLVQLYIYILTKKSLHILHSKLLYKMGQDLAVTDSSLPT